MFATGGVQVYLGPVGHHRRPRESLDRSDNSLVFRAERYVLAVWDSIDRRRTVSRRSPGGLGHVIREGG